MRSKARSTRIIADQARIASCRKIKGISIARIRQLHDTSGGWSWAARAGIARRRVWVEGAGAEQLRRSAGIGRRGDLNALNIRIVPAFEASGVLNQYNAHRAEIGLPRRQRNAG